MGNQLQVQLAAAGEQLQKMAPKFKAALPGHIKPEKFQRVAITALNQNPDLLNCDRLSLLNSCVKCAQDGLLPDGREAALVPFKGQVQYMPMVYGLIKRARQSGELASLSAHVVYERDAFDYELGDDERIIHKPSLDPDRGAIVGAYAIARLKDGTVQREFMSRGQIDEVRNVSRAKNAGPWTQWYGEMARKTVVRRLSKYLPLSAELARTLARDNWLTPMGDGFTEEETEELRDITPETPRPKPEDYKAVEDGTGTAEATETETPTDLSTEDLTVPGGPIDFLANWKAALGKCGTADEVDAYVRANAERIGKFSDEELRNRADEAAAARKEELAA